MRKTKVVPVEGKNYLVKELTPTEVDNLFNATSVREQSTVDGFLDVHHLDTVLLGSMMDVSPERCGEIIGGMTTSEYMPIIVAAKEMNPDFFAMARLRIDRAGQVETLTRMLANVSESALPSSSPTATPTPPITE